MAACPRYSIPAARRLLLVCTRCGYQKFARMEVKQLQGGTMLDTRDRAASVGARPPERISRTRTRDPHAALAAQQAVRSAGAFDDFLHDTRFDASDPAALADILHALIQP